MWGQIITEASMQKNFNFGFCSYKSETLIHLSQWQYWWWFWFSLLWSLYFYIFYKNINNKNLNYNLTINTSMRGHGKWGDFLVSIIPLSWCGNILINSNFILRMIEWQNETSLITIRVQGKQWYWVYKYSGDIVNKLNCVYRNIGNNKWQKVYTKPSKIVLNSNSIANFIFDYEFYSLHNKMLVKHDKLINKLNLTNLCFNNTKWNYKLNEDETHLNEDETSSYLYDNYLEINNNNNFNDFMYTNSKLTSEIFNNENLFNIENTISDNACWVDNNEDLSINNSRHLFIDDILTRNLNINSNYENSPLEDVDETTENLRLQQNIKTIRTKINIKNIPKTNNKNLLEVSFENNSDITTKIPQPENFWGFKQKKNKKLKTFNFIKSIQYKKYNVDDNTNNNILNKYNLYLSTKNNNNRAELIPVSLARRLLRTKRTLVLPAHINITVITNSYDVVHSWFIPGLGIKLDCVPGRSTHHTFYIDNVGFYYGQCAEICGRYHHHMPIRVCALSFEHFYVWWQHKGLHRVCRLEKLNKTKLISKF